MDGPYASYPGTAMRMRSALRAPRQVRRCAAIAAFAGVALGADAAQIEMANPEIKLHWDNTVGYTAAWRVHGPSGILVDAPPTTVNQDDGDRSFNRGLI